MGKPIITAAILADIETAITEMMRQLREKHPNADADYMDASVTERVARTLGRMSEYSDCGSAKKIVSRIRRERKRQEELARARANPHFNFDPLSPEEIERTKQLWRERDEQRARENIRQMEEREAEAKMNLEMIAIGYRALAAKYHPDKIGGSREAMVRLNKGRSRLRANV
jgi:hypothetical protein